MTIEISKKKYNKLFPKYDRNTYNLVCHFDGGCNNTTHSDAYGSFRIRVTNSRIIPKIITRKFDNVFTSNEAEYEAVCRLLRIILLSELSSKDGVGSILIIGDSLLVINQLRGTWKVRAHNLVAYNNKAFSLLKMIRKMGTKVDFMWVPREEVVEVLGH